MRKAVQDLKQKSEKELQKEVDLARLELGKLKLEWKTNRPKDTNSLFKKRKKLAVLLTVKNNL